MRLTGHADGGPGKVSVFSSSLFGSTTGSAVATVMVDGPITIPVMKRAGSPPHVAAGVESVASTGGQIMTPIMGAAGFGMALQPMHEIIRSPHDARERIQGAGLVVMTPADLGDRPGKFPSPEGLFPDFGVIDAKM